MNTVGEAQIINRLDLISARMDQIDGKVAKVDYQTAGALNYFFVFILAVLANFLAIPYIHENNVPLLTDGLYAYIELEQELAIDLGIYLNDKKTGESRHLDFSVPDSIAGLTKRETGALLYNISATESSHNYSAINRFFYLGNWQFGASALAQVGLIKRNRLENARKCVKNGRCQKAFLKNPNNWTIKGGYRAFMNSRTMQDQAMIDLANFNVKTGLRKRVLRSNSPATKIAGYVKAAHLKGNKGAIRWYKYGRDSADGNGTKVSVYARQAEQAVLAARTEAIRNKSRQQF